MAAKKDISLAGRDVRYLRAIHIAKAFVDFQEKRIVEVVSGGGVHVGPPHGDRTNDSECDFSFTLPISDADAKVLESVLKLVLGGTRVIPYADDGSEPWPHSRE